MENTSNIVQTPISSTPIRPSFIRKYKKPLLYGGGVFLIFLILYFGLIRKPVEEVVTETRTSSVKLYEVGAQEDFYGVEALGVVKPETKVDIVSMVPGVVESIFTQEGDYVYAGTPLAKFNDITTITNYTTALSAFGSAQSNYAAINSLSREGITQAEIGVVNAQVGVTSAELSLKSAEDNYNNSKEIQFNSNDSTKEQAIISFDSYRTTAFDALHQINYVIHADTTESQMPGISRTLGAENTLSLNTTKNNYIIVKRMYDSSVSASPTVSSIGSEMNKIVNLFAQIQSLVNQTILVLDNTPSHYEFNDTQLELLKTTFITLHSTVTASYNAAKTTLDSLENMGINNKQEIDQLTNTLDIAKNQLVVAQANLQNAEISKKTAELNRDQQLISAQSNLNNAQGQLSIMEGQYNYLTPVTPINGEVTRVEVEIGYQVSPGQKVAEISNVNLVKIEVDLPADEVYQISVGQNAKINNILNASVSRVSSVADPVTKKVRVEIIFDNEYNELIPETFVDVSFLVDPSTLRRTHELGVMVPLKAVTIGQTESYVFIYHEGKAEKRIVKTGVLRKNVVEITEGLEKGEIIILEGAKNLEDGEEVDAS